jgi:hypothetical protein
VPQPTLSLSETEAGHWRRVSGGVLIRLHKLIPATDGRRVLPEVEDGQQSLVDAPLLLWTHTAYKVAQAAGIDSANLFNKDTGRLA